MNNTAIRGWSLLALRSPSHVLWQSLVLFAVWGYLWSLHADNDGLWFQGDAPRHAINGFFWLDYLRDFTWDAKRYALAYYARYPASHRSDVAAASVLSVRWSGLSVARFVTIRGQGLGALLLLDGCSHLLAWLREWLSAEAGWAAGLFLLLPGTVRWSHAVMLNLPALALGLAALYHARRWLELPDRRTYDFVLAAILTVLGILTYYPTGVVIFVIIIWMTIRGDCKRWVKTGTLLVIGGCILILLPFTWLIAHWAPVQLEWVLPTASTIGSLSTRTFYPARILQIFNAYLLGLAGIGVVVGFADRRWRRETLILMSWVAVLYTVFTLLFAKDIRYALPVMVPLVCLSVIGVQGLCDGAVRRFRWPLTTAPRMVIVVLLILLVCQAFLAAWYRVPAVRGYRELASFLKQLAPEEPVFYDGYYSGLFTFYVRAGDSQFQRRVVVGNKLLYAYALVPGWRQQNFAGSPEEVIQILQRRGGCRWLAVEVTRHDPELLPMRHLREAVKTPAFQLVRSFPIDAPTVERVDVYQFQLPIVDVQEVDLPFPRLGQDVKYRLCPIPTRSSR